MSVINTNITSMIGQQNLSKSQSALATSMERLSSGLRINSAKDDAAGQAIANRMSSQITGLSQAQRNANDGISVAQTAEGALNQVNDNLQRIRELSVQAQNGTNSQDDLNSIQAEIQQRLGEIDRISEQTDFNGVKVLAKDQALNIQVGANDGEAIDINLEKIDSGTLGLSSFNVTGPVGTETTLDATVAAGQFGETTAVTTGVVAGDSTTATNWGTKLGLTGAPSAVAQSVIEDENGNLFVKSTLTVDATQNAELTALGFEETSATTFDIYTAVDAEDATVAGTDATFTVNLADLEVSDLTSGATASPLAALDTALSKVDTLRSDLGAIQNRFESAITNLQTNETNLAAARSRIEDADYAVEVANMTRSQILQQAGTSVLAQANQVPQSVLSLLG
ncbi:MULTISPECIES: FliC/FljB family flagellin [Pseudidiomarina]|uniref:Flagellin n=2 Tax=Pseudidiomarina TaxID=2800384 RepID=A0A317Q9M4_9GAMM|nr:MULTISPECIES: FliC/FljB family flagellin [Pseudidiomarina]PWW13758.1 flagellin [Pseudidiomarina maritima]RCW33166.1 flagellin [Pseudidiomarina tainanensis]